MHIGVLAQVKCRKMKPEHVDGSPQRLQPAGRDHRRPVRGQRLIDDREVGQQLAALGIGRRIADRMLWQVAVVEAARGCRQPRVDAGNRPAVGLVLSIGRPVGRAGSQQRQFFADIDQPVVERQLAAEQMQFVEVMPDGTAALAVHGRAQHGFGDERIAVAIAADPAAEAYERWQHAVDRNPFGGKLGFEGIVKTR